RRVARAGRTARALRGRGVPRGRGHPAAVRPVRRAPADVIRLDGVEKTYRTRRGDLVRAVEDVTLHVEENEFVTLVGPSGCGKSTLLRLVAGLTPATRGAIRVRDTAVSEPFTDVGFVFQQPVLLPWRSVLDNVLFSVEMLGLEPRQHRKQALDLLELTGLSGFETKYPRELSGGMQQRVASCRAQLPDPSLLLMDDTFGELLVPAVPLVGALLVCEAATRLFRVPRFVMPAPSAIAVEGWDWRYRFLGHAWVTLYETLGGFALSIAVGVPLAVLIVYSPVL